ncbi:uncharacterized protein LOC111323779 [Stylophora pistillata]|uniref:uncharacterized protein LOC111323779 n=1 Tax=Stylophora pistillata TaxID=50429 RepID=UPI000C0509C7|nr:uncharacterized protein LOC111323779 [Stylophora pistillata]
MTTFLGTAHLITFILFINCAQGNFTVPVPRKPVLYAYGWPNANKVIASVKTISIEGIVSYDLFLEVGYCPDDSFNPSGKCSSNVTGFTPVDKCHHVENDSSSSTGKVLQCTVCNNSKKCESWGLFSRNKVICAYLEVTTLNGTVCSSCSCRAYSDILVILPAKSLQLLPVSQRELTVLWERPEEMESPILTYKLILRDHSGKCQGNIEDVDDQVQGNQTRNTYSFTNLMPWSSYSVIVCSFLLGGNLVNETTCTCGDHRHQPKGPVFNKTLPEEPTERPDIQPCQAQCSETNFTVTLTWKAGNMFIWNGIPEKSVIRIYQRNSSSQSLEEMYQNTSHNIGNLIKTVHVPLEPNYNGSLMRYSVSNLNSKQTYFSKVQLCSNGGCGPPSAMAVLSCNYCELLGPLSTGNGHKN